MSKRIVLLLLAAAIVMVASSAFAALPVAHQAANTRPFASGDCGACHMPHKAPAIQRGFPLNPSAGSVTTYGYVGAFCMEHCHLVVTAATGDGGNLIYADTTLTVGQAIGGGTNGATIGSHGLNKYNSGANSPAGTTVTNTLPYGNNTRAGNMECTTCHNVHADPTGETALLQLDIDLLCIACHTGRVPAGFAGTGVWGTLYGAGNPGSHPIGTDVNDDSDTAPANSGIRVGIVTAYGSTAFDKPYGTATNHNLGGHLWNGAIGADGNSPLSCVTCHAVHGNQTDPGENQPTTGGNVSEDLLVIAQSAMGAAEPGRHATGGLNLDTNNALCEGCHSHNATANDPNPGATAYSHPVDAMTGSKDMGAIQAAATLAFWPFGTTTGTANIGMGPAGSNRVLCESCHLMHPLANSTESGEDWANVPASGTHLLRRTEAAVCGVCHLSTPPGHHPANVPEAPSANFGARSPIDDDADTTLTCGDCHRSAAGHNWGFNHMPGLAAAWRPNLLTGDWAALVSDNGRSIYEANAYGVAPSITPGGAIIAYANASQECHMCHTSATVYSPTAHTAVGRYQAWGDGSHFLGLTTDTYMQTGLYLGAAFNAETGDWNSAATITMYSKYAGTGALPVVVCESCHTVRIGSFANGTDLTTIANAGKLLVANYAEGTVTQDTGGRAESGLCEGCHNKVAGGTGNTHVLSLENVNRSSRAGLTSGPLTTVQATGLADAPASPGSGDYISGQTGVFNCDGCHQPHDAATNAGTMILDVASANVPLAVGVTAPRSATVNLYGTGDISRSVSTDHQWGKGQSVAGAADSFCSQCHNW